MEAQDINVSKSSLFRFRKVKREHLLKEFIGFKKQYQVAIYHYFSQERVQQIKKIYHHGVCGRNGHRHLVVAQRLGNIRIPQLSKLFEADQLISYINQRMLSISQQLLQQRDQLIWIIDLNGKIMQLASKKNLQALQKIIQNLEYYFPELLYKLVFVNTPMLFDTIWNRIQGRIAKDTLQKVVMIGDQLENLYQFAEPAILPRFLGGEIQDQDFIRGQQFKGKTHAQKQEQEDDEEQEVDFSKLKQALSGMKIEGKALQSVSQTPMNTEADEKK